MPMTDFWDDPSWTGVFGQLPPTVQPMVAKAAQDTGVPLGIMAGHVWNETRGHIFNTPDGDTAAGTPGGVSAGAMQMQAGTLADFNRRHGTSYTQDDLRRDPQLALTVGGAHLADLKAQTGSWPSASLAYARGPSAAASLAAPYTNADGTIDWARFARESPTQAAVIMRNVYTPAIANGSITAPGYNAGPVSSVTPAAAPPGVTAPTVAGRAPVPGVNYADATAQAPQEGAAPQIDTSSRSGDPLVALGLGMLSSHDPKEAMGNAINAYQAAQNRAAADQKTNADLQSQRLERQLQDRQQAANFALTQRGQDVTQAETQQNVAMENARLRQQAAIANQSAGIQTAQLNQTAQHDNQEAALTHEGHTIQAQHDAAMLEYQKNLMRGAPEQFVLPGDSPDKDQHIVGQRNAMGAMTYTNQETGEATPTLPAGSRPLATYNADLHHAMQNETVNAKQATAMLSNATTAAGSNVDLNRVESDLSKPGNLTGPGLGNTFGRYFDNMTGTNTFGSLTQEQLANFDLGKLNWANIKSSTAGTGRLMQSEINNLARIAPTVSSDPVARQQFFQVLRDANNRQVYLGQQWQQMAPADRDAILRSPAGYAQWENTQASKFYQALEQQRAASSKAASPTVAPASRPPLESFGSKPPAAQAPAAATAPSDPPMLTGP